MAKIPPVLLQKTPVPKVWGGDLLATRLGIARATSTTIGETWLLYDRPGGSTEIDGGSSGLVGGGTLRELMERDPEALLGEGVRPGYGDTFPLLLKFIDARERLSLQVHPDDDQAKGEHDSGKHEACVVLAAGPDASMVRGLRPGVSRAEFEAAVQSETLEPLLQTFVPRAGDVIDVPTGTVHSIGPDVLVFEVEQNSDVTYRIYDWGRGRDVQVDKALGAARYEGDDRPVVTPRPLADGGQLLVENAWFRLRRYPVQAHMTFRTAGRFLTLTVIAGAGSLTFGDGEVELACEPGDTVLVPACVDEVGLGPRDGVTLDVLACDPGSTR